MRNQVPLLIVLSHLPPTGGAGRPQLAVIECFEEILSYQDINKRAFFWMVVIVTLAGLALSSLWALRPPPGWRHLFEGNLVSLVFAFLQSLTQLSPTLNLLLASLFLCLSANSNLYFVLCLFSSF